MMYARKIRERRRLYILAFVSRMPDTTCNLDVVHSALVGLGIPSTLDDVRADVVWLTGEGLATIDQLGEIDMLTLTRRGAEVGTGANMHHGVARPLPGDLAAIQGA